MPTQPVIERFREEIGNTASTTDDRQLKLKSRDFHWYSPILTPQLQNCKADVLVEPRSEQEIR